MYRIKKVTTYSGEHYILQKRLLGFLWWYNPDNIDAMTTRIYGTKYEAQEAHKHKTHERLSEIIKFD